MNQIPKKGYRQLRKGRKSIAGIYYSITVATKDRRSILTRPGIPEVIFRSLNWLETEKYLKWMCIMVMPDHVHIVIELGDKRSLAQVVYSFKRFTANQINIHLGQKGQVWQDSYHDHGIRNDESLKEIIRYFYENPVRKDMVKNPADYPYWRCKYKM